MNLSKEEMEAKIKNGEPYVIRQKINDEGFIYFKYFLPADRQGKYLKYLKYYFIIV